MDIAYASGFRLIFISRVGISSRSTPFGLLRARVSMSAKNLECEGFDINRLLLVPAPCFFVYYSSMVLSGPHRSLTFVIARYKFAVSVMLQFPPAASSGVTSTISLDNHLTVRQPCLIYLEPAVIGLVDHVGYLLIPHQFCFDLILAYRA